MVDTTGLYFVITDGVRARFVRADPRHRPHTILTVDRMSMIPGPGHGTAPRNPSESGAPGFEVLLAERLSGDFAVDIFTTLVLIAPPPVLCKVSAMLDAPASGCVIGKLPGNLIDVPDPDLAPHLERWLASDEND